MTWRLLSAAVMATAFSALVGCENTPVAPVAVPAVSDASAYRPVPAPKQLPPDGYIPPSLIQPQQPQQPGMAGGPGAPGTLVISPSPSIKNEDAFVATYQKRSPRMMIFVNRTIEGDPISNDRLQELMRVEHTQSSTGAVAVTNSNTVTGSGQSASAGFGGSSAASNNTNRNNSSSFTSGGPAQYNNTTSIKVAGDNMGIGNDDYQMIEASITRYFDNSGKIRVQDSDAARSKLSREQLLRIENGDPAANRLLATELQADVLVRVTASPTTQAASGTPAIRLVAKAVGTTDARNLGTAFVDMPLPVSKTNINLYTQYLTSELMGQMALKWAQPDTIEVRIYKAASIDDSLKIQQWLQATKGVSGVRVNGATGGASTSYADFAVGYDGAPEGLYADLKAAIGMSQGLKAVDLQSNTINLEVTGPMNLVTTTRHVESTTTTETGTTEDRRVEPINPAPAQ
ncbi:MAG TPA: hypothetical protein VGN88_11570 [Phycisphaerae bacterium]|jgi:hypothetical protein